MDISFRYAVISKTSADVSTLIETCPGPGVGYTINQRKVELASLKTGYIYGQRFLLRKFKEPLAQIMRQRHTLPLQRKRLLQGRMSHLRRLIWTN
jgi:hypothetical protein